MLHTLGGKAFAAPQQHAALWLRRSGGGVPRSPSACAAGRRHASKPHDVEVAPGWGVSVASEDAADNERIARGREAGPATTGGSSSSSGRLDSSGKRTSAKRAAKHASSSKRGAAPAAAAATAAAAAARPAGQPRSRGTPFVELQSEEGLMGLALLQQALVAEGKDSGQDVAAVKALVAQQMSAGVRTRKRLPALPNRRVENDDEGEEEEEEEEEELSQVPEFQLTFGDEGTEFIEFDREGNAKQRSNMAAVGADVLEEFGDFGWEQFMGDATGESEEEDEYDEDVGDVRAERDAAILRDMSNEDDWGLEGLDGRPSLMADMARAQAAADAALSMRSSGDNVSWGGSAGATGIDMDEQEALLHRYFKADKVKKLMAQQREIDANYSQLKMKRAGALPSEHRLHRQLRIISGSAAGKSLLSSRGAKTRPMMEKVRAAIFSMILSQAGVVSALPETARWLDLFAGTGSVGLEALSRGAAECHFVEMDPWVVRNVLGKNITHCNLTRRAVCHTFKAEDFLRKAKQLPRFAGGAFDFVSVCPPYLLVSYPELFDLLSGSPLLHERSIVFVEYPKQLAHDVPQELGSLVKVRDRKYGRTYIAVYGPVA